MCQSKWVCLYEINQHESVCEAINMSLYVWDYQYEPIQFIQQEDFLYENIHLFNNVSINMKLFVMSTNMSLSMGDHQHEPI